MRKTNLVRFLIVFLISFFIFGCKKEHVHNSDEVLFNDEYHYQLCNDCGKEYNIGWHELTEKILEEATCTKSGSKEFSCTCGYKKIVEIPLKSHTYLDEWKYNSEYHYKECTCSAIEENSKEIHVFDDGQYLKNECLTYTCKICGYQKDENITKEISLIEVEEIGQILSSNKGVSTNKYKVTGIITKINGNEVTIEDNNYSLILYNEQLTVGIYYGYKVTVEGYIQNYYGKIEIINYTLLDFIPLVYNVEIKESLNGSITVSKTSSINWGEEITVTPIPDIGYKLSNIFINNIRQNLSDKYTVIVEDNINIVAEFVLDEIPIEIFSINTYNVNDYKIGTELAENEIHKLNDDIKIITNKCYWNNELQIYENGNVIIESKYLISELILNVGYDFKALSIYGSIDGTNYTFIKTINVKERNQDYIISLQNDFKYFKLVSTGEVRIKYFTFTTIIEKPVVIEVTDVEIELSIITLQVKESINCNARVYPYNATDRNLTYESSDTDVVTVSSSGLITALKPGTAEINIYATNRNIYNTILVTVRDDSSETDYFTIYSIEMMGTYGDSTLIQYGDYDILIDGGTDSDSSYVEKAVEEKVTDHVLDLLIVTHPDTDHFNGLLPVSTLASLDEVKTIITNCNSQNYKILDPLKTYFPESNYKIITDYVSKTNLIYSLDVDEYFSIDFLYQDNYTNTKSNKNNQSICLTINYKNTIVFMAGDLENNGCNSIMKYFPNLTKESDYVIFKALHHGSSNSNSQEFIKYIKPDLCFVSAGMRLSSPGNVPNYNTHPYVDALCRIGSYTEEIYWSGITGNLLITCDGEMTTLLGDGRSRDYYYTKASVPGQYFKASRIDEVAVSYFASDFYRMAIENLHYPNYKNINLQ